MGTLASGRPWAQGQGLAGAQGFLWTEEAWVRAILLQIIVGVKENKDFAELSESDVEHAAPSSVGVADDGVPAEPARAPGGSVPKPAARAPGGSVPKPAAQATQPSSDLQVALVVV